MKLFFYINLLGGGGAERVMVNLANQFAVSGNEVTLVASYPYEKEYAVSNSVERLYLEDKKSAMSFAKKNYLYVRKLRLLIKEKKPDAAIAFMAEPNIRLLIAATGLKTKKIISVRNDPMREYSSKIYRMAAKILFPHSDLVVFQTEDAKRYFSQRIQKRATIIMNQVADTFFSFERPKDTRNIVTVGRLNNQKNQKMLIDAFSKISDKIEDDLVIWGEGELRDGLEAYVCERGLEGRVFLPGRTEDVPQSIGGAKVFVLPSDYEGMPNALLEAMALGLPCVSTDCPCGGPKMIIRDGENGYLVPIRDIDLMADRIERLLCNDELRSKFSANAGEFAKNFSPEKIFGEWDKAIRKTIE